MTARLRAALQELEKTRNALHAAGIVKLRYPCADPSCVDCELPRAIDAVLSAAEAEEREG